MGHFFFLFFFFLFIFFFSRHVLLGAFCIATALRHHDTLSSGWNPIEGNSQRQSGQSRVVLQERDRTRGTAFCMRMLGLSISISISISTFSLSLCLACIKNKWIQEI
jgi:hypothetical protein